MKRLPFPGTTFELKQAYRNYFHCLLLLVWVAVGTGLRFSHLTAKPPWMDEVATVIFSLGNSSHTIPLNQVVGLEDLLRPLQPNPQAGIGSVVQHLFAEDNHPPVYFMLAHAWMKLFSPEDGVASVWAARSLPALLGVLSIPATFMLGWLVRSRLVGQLAAALMAVSPYGIYLAQEARHYTLAILLVIASLCCLIMATQAINNRRPLPVWVGLLWLVINNLGIAVHYFFTLTLGAEALALAGLKLWYWRQAWVEAWRFYAVGAGTLLGGLLWLPAWQSFSGSEQTSWLSMGEQRSFMEWINPIFQTLAGWITMLMLLPVETKNLLVAAASVLVMLIVLVWATPILSRGLKAQLQQPHRLGTQILGGFVLGAIALFFSITYVSGLDITRGSRYNFVYFPGIIVLAGVSLAACWSERQTDRRFPPSSKQAVVLIWLIGFFSALTVVNNLGFAKFYRPERLIPVIQQQSQAPVLIASTVHKTQQATVLGHDFLGLAWEIKRHFNPESPVSGWTAPPQFLLAQYSQNPQTAEAALVQALNQQRRPLDLWLVNFVTEPKLRDQQCFASTAARQQVSSYLYQHYRCPGADQAG